MKIAYFDCAAGIAGDMCLGALLDCGVPLEYLNRQLQALGIEGEYSLQVSRVQRCGQPALQAVVEVLGSQSGGSLARHWAEIQALIAGSQLSPAIKARSLAVFEKLAQAEAKVHQVPVEKVHFHEVGAVDALVDIVGTCIGLDWLQVERVLSSPHPIGGGWVSTEHGKLAVPVPAVIELWEMGRVPVFSNGVEAELVTPTGAALAVALAEEFGPCPPMRVEKVGRGAGAQELPIPNVFRLWIGEADGGELTETVSVLQTQIDDLNPQVIAYTCEQLLALGAWDVFTQPITMKQGRPGILLTVICPPDRVPECQDLIFRETTTLGIRHFQQQRTLLERVIERVETPYGLVDIKVARHHGRIVNAQPEFRDCVARAQEFHVPVQTVWLAAQSAWQNRLQG
ncbi:nickel pincer cofactor biosynthesis protein LarC [Thermostichus sp. MS-CIW-38]